jgi:hypothetical protein
MHDSSAVAASRAFVSASHSFSRIVYLDLGKFNSVLCFFDPAGSSPPRFQSIATSPASIHDLLSGLIKTPEDAGS